MVRTIRELLSTDVDALHEVLESVPSYSERVTGYPPGPSDALGALMSVPPDFDPSQKKSIGLWEDEELIAFVDVLVGHPDLRTAFIGLLIVKAGHHGRGNGRDLHDAVLARGRVTGDFTTMRLGIIETVASDAEPFWRALGYSPTGELKSYIYDRLASTVAMWERIAAIRTAPDRKPIGHRTHRRHEWHTASAVRPHCATVFRRRTQRRR